MGNHRTTRTGLARLLAAWSVFLGCQLQPFVVEELPDTAEGLWWEARQAHTGGRDIVQLRFNREDTLLAAVSGFAVPELGPVFSSRTVLSFQPRTAWQSSDVGDGPFVWAWDGKKLTTFHDGRTFPPPPGLDRARLLHVLGWELNPTGIAPGRGVDMVVLPPTGRRSRLRVSVAPAKEEGFVLEIDSRTSWVTSVEGWWREGVFPVRIRAELSDHRDVGGGIVVPHVVTESLLVGGGALRYRTARLWNVEATSTGRPPRPPGRTGPGGERGP